MEAFEAELRAAFDEMIALLLAKRNAYGSSNLTRFGGIGIAMRADDKVSRLANLYQSGRDVSADGESIEDAYRDICGYGVLGLLYHRGKLHP